MGELEAQRRSFVDNRNGNTVAAALASAAAYYGNSREIAIASGYFDLDGFGAVAQALEAAPAVRILLGTEPEPPRPRRVALPGTPPPPKTLGDQLAALRQSLAADRDLAEFAQKTSEDIRRLLAFLGRPTTEVRLYRRGFLHGKAFIFGTEAGILAGSANFTGAGLSRNLELDLGVYDPDKVALARSWYDDLWGQAEPFDLAALYRERERDYDPYTIYLRMLYELYGAELTVEGGRPPITAPSATIRLAEFQQLGVRRALRILDRWGGVLVADGVGLGKTFVAGGLIEHHLVDRGWRVLVVTPAALRDATWQDFVAKLTRFKVDVVSFQELANDTQVGDPPTNGPDRRQQHLPLDAAEYRLIVIDEAHAFRNPETTYYRALRRLMAAGGVEKRLVLLTATPVNNSLWDLYWQILLFARSEARFAGVGISNLREYFAKAMSLDLEALSPSHLFPLLDAVSVRRTRNHIKKYFPNATLETPKGPVPIVFPVPKLHRVGYEAARPADAPGAAFFDEVSHAIDAGLSMARYQPDIYRLHDDGEKRAQAVTAGLLLSQLLKRFESSLEAFRRTLRVMIGSHRRFLEVLDQGFVAHPRTSPEVWQEGLDDEGLAALLADDANARPIGEYAADDLRSSVQGDLAVLERLLHHAETIGEHDDPKLDALLDTLALVQRRAAHADERKVVLFSYYADTVQYLDAFLERTTDRRFSGYRARFASVVGDMDSDARAHVVNRFAPRSTDAREGTPDEYDLLLSTDVLAEGQNLQQCGTVFNFDIPWNPMRLVQRNGRVDRIGSPHRTVHLHTFFPDKHLSDMLDLEERLRRKIAQANAAVGLENSPVPDIKTFEHVFDDTRSDIERIAGDDASVIDEKEAELDAFSGEGFREELRQALMADREAELGALPWGIGSGFKTARARGVVFAARAGSRIEWRFVPLPLGDLRADRLPLLGYAQCAPETLRYVPDATRDLLFELWGRARTQIVSERLDELDPLKREARVPKAQRDAVAVLYGSVRLDPAVVERTVDALAVPWPPTVARSLRAIIDRQDASAEAKAEQLVQFVSSEGLRPPTLAVESPISVADVHLVCYQVVEA